MNRINYRSDFTLTLALLTPAGDPIGIPPFDFTLRLSTASVGNYFEVTQRDGILANAVIQNGQILAVLDNHRLFPGQLQARLIANIPDPLYPDGFRRIEARQSLETTLDRDTTALDYDAITETIIIPLSLAEVEALPTYPTNPDEPDTPADTTDNPCQCNCNCNGSNNDPDGTEIPDPTDTDRVASTSEVISEIEKIFS